MRSALSWLRRWGAGAFTMGTPITLWGGIPKTGSPSIFRVPFSKDRMAFTQDSCSGKGRIYVINPNRRQIVFVDYVKANILGGRAKI